MNGNSLSFYYGVNGTFTRYDNVTFFSTSPLSFYVSSSFTPAGNMFDMEFVLGGGGNGSSVYFNALNATFSLFYYNGFNYQDVPAAVNYGITTAETAPDINATLFHNDSGSLCADLKVGTNYRGYLYTPSEVSTLSVNSTVPGELLVNGSSTPVPWHAIISLYPGNYNVSFVHLSLIIYQKDILFRAGELSYISVDPRKYAVTFSESTNVSWSVSIDNQTVLSSGRNISFALTNGTYNYSVSLTSAGGNSTPYYPFPYSGTVTIKGFNITIPVTDIVPVSVSFKSNVYPFTFTVNGTSFTVSSREPVVFPSGSSLLVFYPLHERYGTLLFPFNSSSNTSTYYTPGGSSNYTFGVYYQTNYLLNLWSDTGYATASMDNTTIKANSSLYVASNSTVYLNANYTDGSIGFSEWYGQGIRNYSGGMPDVSIIMVSPMNETAIYSKLYFVEVHINGITWGNWSVTVDNRTISSNKTSIYVPIVNGTYLLTVDLNAYLKASPSSFDVMVNGSNITYDTGTTVNYWHIVSVIISPFVSMSFSIGLDLGIVALLAVIFVLVNRVKRK